MNFQAGLPMEVRGQVGLHIANNCLTSFNSKQLEEVRCQNSSSTIMIKRSCFVSSMQELILPVFRDILLVCEKEGLLGGTSPDEVRYATGDYGPFFEPGSGDVWTWGSPP